ncbi:MAG: hypothetical protein ACP5DZ_03200 [Bacteroidales bacterium]
MGEIGYDAKVKGKNTASDDDKKAGCCPGTKKAGCAGKDRPCGAKNE